jgi:predicted lipid-binding transport protein (Tim44 family)
MAIRRSGLLLAGFAALGLALAPGLAFARAGGTTYSGSSMGSRGTRTYTAPPTTNTSPYTAAPMQRSLTPSTPSRPAYGAAPAYGGRSPFMSGLMGGLLGAGIGGLLFGGGLFHGISGFGGFLGFLIQIFLLVVLGRFLFRLFMNRSPSFAPATGPGLFARVGAPAAGMPAGGGGGGGGATLAISQSDFQSFEQLLQQVQAAWSAHDLNRLSAIATPEMASYFAEQMAEQTSRGVRNMVRDVKLEQGDLAEAWAESGREYATVAMRFSMVDVTVDSTGRVVEGDPGKRAMATEIWTFLRSPGGSWLLSAIQQTR